MCLVQILIVTTQVYHLSQVDGAEMILQRQTTVPFRFLAPQIRFAEVELAPKHLKPERVLRPTSYALLKNINPPNAISLSKARSPDESEAIHVSTTKPHRLHASLGEYRCTLNRKQGVLTSCQQ